MWVCPVQIVLLGGSVLGWAALPAQSTLIARGAVHDVSRTVGAWAGRRVAVQWQGATSAQVVADLADRLGRPIWMTDAARRRAGRTRVRFAARHLTGFQAVSALCRLAGLRWLVIDGAIVLTDATRTPGAWRLASRALRLRVLAEHPQWARAHAGRSAADLDLVDTTPSAALARLGDAYQLDLWMSEAVRSGQTLVTPRGVAIPLKQAIAEFARQLAVRAVDSDGVIWLLARDEPGSVVEGAFAEEAGPGVPERETVGQADRWIRLRAATIIAEGRADDIRAVRQWRGAHGEGRGKRAAVPPGAVVR